MARTFGDFDNVNLLTSNKNWIFQMVSLPIGATGAPGTTTGVSGYTFTRSTNGVYTVTCPPGVDAVIFPFVRVSAALTVVDCVVTAQSATAGTFTVKSLNASGVATDPANGDILGFFIFAKSTAI